VDIATSSSERVYRNKGNAPLMALLEGEVGRVLDIGCGAGDNAALIRRMFPECEIHGVTRSEAEARIARPIMTSCRVCDIEHGVPQDIRDMRFDVLIFSHVLEHLRHPDLVAREFSLLLRTGGFVLIAVPNVLAWATRWRLLIGKFEYQSEGVLDDTHLRFFTYFTADRYLLQKCPDLKLVFKGVSGTVPLWLLRRHVLPTSWSRTVDAAGCRLWPNLFGSQILIKARRVAP